jgi:hypothetical protein
MQGFRRCTRGERSRDRGVAFAKMCLPVWLLSIYDELVDDRLREPVENIHCMKPGSPLDAKSHVQVSDFV